MAIRVLRIIEYIYENAEIASRDIDNWTPNIRNKVMVMRSATLPFEAVKWEEGTTDADA